jgi:hypothetical protein
VEGLIPVILNLEYTSFPLSNIFSLIDTETRPSTLKFV